jgi:predicted heme/steroid binding protein
MENVSNPGRRFTRPELAQYDGQNGKPAYMAVNNTVYDVTPVFVQGQHFTHVAGRDLTGAFLRQHVPAALSGYQVVGILVDAE